MDPVRFSIENPVKVAVGVILLLLFGLVAFTVIPVQLTPNTDPTIITVTTDWTGKSPDEIEREIIEEQEDVLKNVRNLVKMTATASQGQAEIELEFTVGTDLQAARVEVSDSLREVPEYPEGADEPVVNTGEAGAGSPIAWLILRTAGPGFDVQSFGDSAEETIKPFLERTPGVSEVRVYGGREREVHVTFDPRTLATRGVTFDQIDRALRGENVNVSAGEVQEGRYDVRIRVIGQYDALEQVRRTIVAYDAGGPIRIEDLAEVELTFEKRRSFVRSRGEVAMALPVYRESGANVITVMEGVRERVRRVNDELLPRLASEFARDFDLARTPQLSLEQVYDETVYIYDALALVQNNLFIGGSLAIVALLLFLRIIRPTLVIAMAIPISIIGTFVVMAALGRNINVISLAGLAFAVGMVVDNAIVVLENIDRHLQMGKPRARAAYDAGREVWGAILASTLTTLAVFVPVLTVEEEAGQLFRDIAIAICAAVSLSLLVSITVIPSASARFLRERGRREGPILKTLHNLFGLVPACRAGTRGFTRALHWLTFPDTPRVILRVLIVGLFTLLSLGGAYLLMPPADYLPRGNKNLVFGVMLRPPGYALQTHEQAAQRVESIIRPYWEAETYEQLEGLPPVVNPFTQQPVENLPPIENYFFVAFRGNVFNGAISEDKNNVAPMADLLSAATTSVPGSIGFAQQSSIFGRGASGARAIEVEVSGSNLDSVTQSAAALMWALRQRYGFQNIQPTPLNFDKQGREMSVRIDRVRAADLGVSTATLGDVVASLVDGAYVGDYRLRGEAIDMLLQRDRSLELSPEDLGRTPVAYELPTGERGTVPLSSVAALERSLAPQQILRIEEQRAVRLEVTPPDQTPLESATQEIREMEAGLRAGGRITPDVQVALAGSASKLEQVREALLGRWTGWNLESLKSLGFSRLFIALLVTYLLMAALFESFVYPLVIMFAVPLATVGGFLGLRITHEFVPTQQLDTLTMLGFIILIGVVVNNAILIVHQALNFMRGVGEGEGDDTGVLRPREALRASVRSRVRPIFMTTFTSVSGMLPLVLMPGSGSELYRGLGSVVVGGLICATVFTLIVVPLLFSLAMDLRAVLVGQAAHVGPAVAGEPAGG